MTPLPLCHLHVLLLRELASLEAARCSLLIIAFLDATSIRDRSFYSPYTTDILLLQITA